LFVEPTNRPFKSTQVQERTPSPVGYLGDVPGTMAADANYFYVCTGTFDAIPVTGVPNANSTTSSGNIITFDASLPAGVVLNMPVVFDTMFIANVSVTSFGGINKGEVYYVKTISGANITISDTRSLVETSPGVFTPTAGNTFPLTTVAANTNTYMDATFYDGTDIWKRVALSSW